MTNFSKLPKLGFGMMRLPIRNNNFGDVDVEAVKKMADVYLARGYNYFDTAYPYHNQDSERAVKAVLTDRYPRESFFLADKLPPWLVRSKEDPDRVLAGQLERTGAGYFDFYLLHSIESGRNYDNLVRNDAFEWLAEKQREGRVRHIGFSFHDSPELLDEILTKYPFLEFVQLQINYIDWDNERIRSRELYEVARKHDKPILVMEPLKGGMLTALTPEMESVFRVLRPEDSNAAWGLRFAASLPGVAVVLSGMSDLGQVEDNLRIFDHFEPVSEQEHEAILRVVDRINGLPVVPCTRCRYCTEGCPKRIDIPGYIALLNNCRRYGPERALVGDFELWNVNSGKPSDCVSCGQCESICPQHLPIMSLMGELAGIMGQKRH